MPPEREPGRSELGASSIACSSRSAAAARSPFQLQVAREIEPAVGHQIAGGEKQASRAWVGTDWSSKAAGGRREHLDEPYNPMRPQDILMPVPAGLCCKPGGFHIDPVRPVERAVITHGHSDHARPGHGAVLATQETLDMMRLRYGDNFAAQHAGDRLWRRNSARRRHRQISSGRPRARLGADRGHLRGHLHRRLRRLQGRARSDLRAVRSGALRRLHHRGDVRPAGVPPWRRGGRGGEAAGVGRRCFRSARIWSAPIRSARRSA